MSRCLLVAFLLSLALPVSALRGQQAPPPKELPPTLPPPTVLPAPPAAPAPLPEAAAVAPPAVRELCIPGCDKDIPVRKLYVVEEQSATTIPQLNVRDVEVGPEQKT